MQIVLRQVEESQNSKLVGRSLSLSDAHIEHACGSLVLLIYLSLELRVAISGRLAFHSAKMLGSSSSLALIEQNYYTSLVMIMSAKKWTTNDAPLSASAISWMQILCSGGKLKENSNNFPRLSPAAVFCNLVRLAS